MNDSHQWHFHINVHLTWDEKALSVQEQEDFDTGTGNVLRGKQETGVLSRGGSQSVHIEVASA